MPGASENTLTQASADARPGGSVGIAYGEMHFLPDGTLKLLDRGKEITPRPGHWKASKKGDKVTLKMDDREGDAAVC